MISFSFGETASDKRSLNFDFLFHFIASCGHEARRQVSCIIVVNYEELGVFITFTNA